MSDNETHRLATELETRRDDAGEWEDVAEPFEVRPQRSEVVSFRLPRGELDALEAAAAAVGQSVSGFVRSALAARLNRSLIEGSLIDLWAGSGTVVIRRMLGAAETGSRSENQGGIVPDFPPTLTNITPELPLRNPYPDRFEH